MREILCTLENEGFIAHYFPGIDGMNKMSGCSKLLIKAMIPAKKNIPKNAREQDRTALREF